MQFYANFDRAIYFNNIHALVLMDNPDNKPATLVERLVGAFVSAIAMAGTIVGLSIMFFIMLAKGRGIELFFDVVFSKVSLYVIAGAAVMGFFLSIDTMLIIFGSLWGTNTEKENASINKFVIAISFAVAIGVAVWLIRLG